MRNPGGALGWFWYLAGHWNEGCRWLSQILVNPGVLELIVARAKALYAGAVLISYQQEDYALARTWLEESVTIWRQIGDHSGLAYSLAMLGLEVLYSGALPGARFNLEESVSLARRT